ncbi:MAG: glycosyltransferase family 4 protein [Waddliaceae bacterium]|jgi:glycosyltransferase involved in cell wall biosynthesis|nr:glycosyltransferase family 4 protein [Waddliaceae bacterium]
MHILHTEASPGWGGQEIRILRESEGLRERGHDVIFIIQENGGLVEPARRAGFTVYELPLRWGRWYTCLKTLMSVIKRHAIDVVSTHSSRDAWLAGIAGKIVGCKVVRTRHLSTAIKKGLNSFLLYRVLADDVVTTCEYAADLIRKQAKISIERCRSVPTGVDPRRLDVDISEVKKFREDLGVGRDDILVGTACILRGWKGVFDMLKAAKILQEVPDIKWAIVGNGVSEKVFLKMRDDLGLKDTVIFTGYIEKPQTAIAAMDIFTLLSTGNEGVSQASLQAGFLKKPMITTNVGGLGEVCIDGKTGFIVPAHSPENVAEAIMKLYGDEKLRNAMGKSAQDLVVEQFSFNKMLDDMEKVYAPR